MIIIVLSKIYSKIKKSIVVPIIKNNVNKNKPICCDPRHRPLQITFRIRDTNLIPLKKKSVHKWHYETNLDSTSRSRTTVKALLVS
ncbi:hypothetical protein BpHYR1_047600 [Brachionus plicatilis]|uniref:Uncharacterized protein n=1 Tax=Brachionus plicatilis TaxID=10195 RepID=A0A3M7RSC9_BRAPC|nr:hypothetical protein BpHYR1_047600 [Brachionus plicatilis]